MQTWLFSWYTSMFLTVKYQSIFGLVQGGPQKIQKLNEYPTTKSVNYKSIRAW